MDKIIIGSEVLIKGKVINGFENGNVRIEFGNSTPEFPEFQINIPKDQIVAILPHPETCTCEKPEEYIERSSATGDKNYTGQCIKCLKTIKPLGQRTLNPSIVVRFHSP